MKLFLLRRRTHLKAATTSSITVVLAATNHALDIRHRRALRVRTKPTLSMPPLLVRKNLRARPTLCYEDRTRCPTPCSAHYPTSRTFGELTQPCRIPAPRTSASTPVIPLFMSTYMCTSAPGPNLGNVRWAMMGCGGSEEGGLRRRWGHRRDFGAQCRGHGAADGYGEERITTTRPAPRACLEALGIFMSALTGAANSIKSRHAPALIGAAGSCGTYGSPPPVPSRPTSTSTTHRSPALCVPRGFVALPRRQEIFAALRMGAPSSGEGDLAVSVAPANPLGSVHLVGTGPDRHVMWDARTGHSLLRSSDGFDAPSLP
ncbi:hypothetical protein DFH09DRAFT_1309528 [Mycena vulgaris]|nr:hypothetical protein DFH09DRAFT_1309528 [Mycena vulgaris]